MEKCYGNFMQGKVKCRKCSLVGYCKSAGNPALLSVFRTEEDISRLAAPDFEKENLSKMELEVPQFSRADLMEVIVFMASLDIKALDLIDEKLRDFAVPMSRIAARRKISRQAVHKLIKQRCEKYPELNTIFNSQKSVDKSITQKKHQLTFMEAICQIRKETLARKSQQQKLSLKSSKKLTCSIQSFDLSKMSIIKGGAICKAG